MADGKIRVAMVTGATGIIGAAIVRGLAGTSRFEVIPTGRNPEKVREFYPQFRQGVHGGIVLDQGLGKSVQSLASEWKGPLHVLIINATATPLKRVLTPEGVETQWAVNVLGYHRLIKALSPVLYQTAWESDEPSRVVVVASCWAGDLDLKDPEFKRRRYDNGTAYRQSKQAERMLSSAWASFLRERYGTFQKGPHAGSPYVTVNACHPGEVNTPLSNSLGFGGHETPEEGADTPLWLATAKELSSISGGWFTYRKQSPCRFASDGKAVRDLWDLVESYG